MNKERMELDKNNNIFMPKTFSVNTDNENFMSVPKIAILTITVLGTIAYISNISKTFKIWFVILMSLIAIGLAQLIIRKTVLMENYFKKMFRNNKKYKKCTPGVFWNIPAIHKTDSGDIIMFSNSKIGCFVRLVKGNIVGRDSDSKEEHIDAWSDFYRHINSNELSIVQMNLMEPAGTDDRIGYLTDLVSKCDNNELKEILERELGFIKEVSRVTLIDTDYILVYTMKSDKIDSLIETIKDGISILLNGGYSGASILKEYEIYQIPKLIDNVGFFDGIEAQVNVYNEGRVDKKDIASIIGIQFNNPDVEIELNDSHRSALKKLSKLADDGQLEITDGTIYNELTKK